MANQQRRRLLKAGLFGLAALPFGMGAMTRQAFAAELPLLPEDNPQAKALHYKHDATQVNHPKYQAGQACHNCMFFKPDNNGCALFPANSVDPNGWCQSWTKKPG